VCIDSVYSLTSAIVYTIDHTIVYVVANTHASILETVFFFFSSRRRHTRSVSAFLLNRSSDLTLILNTFLFGVIILIANILKRAFSSQLAAKLRNRLLVLLRIFARSEERRVGKESRSTSRRDKQNSKNRPQCFAR